MCWEGGSYTVWKEQFMVCKGKKTNVLTIPIATAVSWLMKIPKDSPFGEAFVTVFLENIHIYFFPL